MHLSSTGFAGLIAGLALLIPPNKWLWMVVMSVLVRVYPFFLRVGLVGHLLTKQVPGLTNAG